MMANSSNAAAMNSGTDSDNMSFFPPMVEL